jgi:hypothetical protein
MHLLAQSAPQQLGHGLDHASDVEGARIERQLPGKSEQALRQPTSAVGTFARGGDELVERLAFALTALDQVQRPIPTASRLLRSWAMPPVS